MLIIGHETCERLLPQKSVVEKHLLDVRHKTIVFLTPFVTDQGFLLLKETLPLLREKDEIFANDWGVLWFFSQVIHAKIFIGRILSTQFLFTLMRQKEESSIQKIKHIFQDKIVGLEFDDISESQKQFLQKFNFQYRLCDRPQIISVTRRCIFNRASKSLDQFADCQKECLGHPVMAENMLLKQKFLFSGNAIYRA